MAYHRHTLDVYDVELHLVTTRRSLTRLMESMPNALDADDVVDGYGSTSTVHENLDSGGVRFHLVFWVDPALHVDEPPAVLIDTCAHEATHGAGAILDYVQASDQSWTSEPFAYLVGWLTRWVWTHVS